MYSVHVAFKSSAYPQNSCIFQFPNVYLLFPKLHNATTNEEEIENNTWKCATIFFKSTTMVQYYGTANTFWHFNQQIVSRKSLADKQLEQ